MKEKKNYEGKKKKSKKLTYQSHLVFFFQFHTIYKLTLDYNYHVHHLQFQQQKGIYHLNQLLDQEFYELHQQLQLGY